MTGNARRRFWRTAGVAASDRGFAIRLDHKPLRTPRQAELVVPTAALAAALAAEWNAVEGEIRPEALPLTRAANTAIDRVGTAGGQVATAIAAYGEADLLCYRAEAPQALRDRQAAAWDPWLAWSAQVLGAPLVAVDGVMHHAQPGPSLARLRRVVAAHDPFALTALHDLVTLSGSLVLGLAVSRAAIGAEAAWLLSRIDEDWQAEQWGPDPEAEAAADARRRDFLRARSLLDLLAA